MIGQLRLVTVLALGMADFMAVLITTLFVIGTLVVNTLGESLVGAMLALLGAAKIKFETNIGPSGSRKSTLLYNISGMDQPTSGSVNLGDTEITKLSQKELSPQTYENGIYFSINRYAISLMNQTGISNLSDCDITEASGGQLQPAGICRAIINNPDIIFDDEPTGTLNSKTTLEILGILRRVNEQGESLAVVIHDAKVAA